MELDISHTFTKHGTIWVFFLFVCLFSVTFNYITECFGDINNYNMQMTSDRYNGYSSTL